MALPGNGHYLPDWGMMQHGLPRNRGGDRCSGQG